jgi:hypothetical protein
VQKTPRLAVVDQNFAPPSGLGKAGTKLWADIKREYRIDDAGGNQMLLQICNAADRAAECAEIIAADGPVIKIKQGIKDHPLLRHELAARSFVVRSLHRLGLDIEPTRGTVGRPPGTFNHPRGDR